MASEHDHLLLVASSAEDPAHEREVLTAFCARRVDGLVVVPTNTDHSLLSSEIAAGTAIVFVDRPGVVRQGRQRGDGHELVVVEQDDLEPAPDVESAAAKAHRPSAPQVVHPHSVMARCRELLIDHVPDFYEALLRAGAVEAPLAHRMPASLADRAARPGDERLTTLMTRRSTFDWVLARALLVEPGVTIRYGTRAVGLRARRAGVPQVTGVQTDRGDLDADLVVDAAGRRSPIDRWLEEIGTRAPVTQRAECGVTYYSRHYRLRPGAELPGLATTRMLDGLEEFAVAIFGADNATMQLVVVPLATDRRFRGVNDPDVFDSVLRTVPAYAAWIEVMDPISPVFQMVAPPQHPAPPGH